MRVITWNLQVEGGAVNNTFSSKAIFGAFARLMRYFQVEFRQVPSNPWMRVILTNRWHSSGNPNVAAWTTGRSIYVPRFRFYSNDHALYVMLHELGHVIGGGSHGAPGTIMDGKIVDIYRNFAPADTNWFYIPMKPGIKPWQEPNYWRPANKAFAATAFEDSVLGHAQWRDRLAWIFHRNTVVPLTPTEDYQ